MTYFEALNHLKTADVRIVAIHFNDLWLDIRDHPTNPDLKVSNLRISAVEWDSHNEVFRHIHLMRHYFDANDGEKFVWARVSVWQEIDERQLTISDLSVDGYEIHRYDVVAGLKRPPLYYNPKHSFPNGEAVPRW